jgi:hypothetical protein
LISAKERKRPKGKGNRCVFGKTVKSPVRQVGGTETPGQVERERDGEDPSAAHSAGWEGQFLLLWTSLKI